jgi:hypothetical protein
MITPALFCVLHCIIGMKYTLTDFDVLMVCVYCKEPLLCCQSILLLTC